MIERRKFLTSLVGLVAAPAIVRVASIMPVKMDRDWRHIVHRDWKYIVRRVDIDVTEVYGRSPAMDAPASQNVLIRHYPSEDMTFQGVPIRVVTGLVPFYDNPENVR